MAVFKIVYNEDFGPAPTVLQSLEFQTCSGDGEQIEITALQGGKINADVTETNANEIQITGYVEFDPSNGQVEDPC